MKKLFAIPVLLLLAVATTGAAIWLTEGLKFTGYVSTTGGTSPQNMTMSFTPTPATLTPNSIVTLSSSWNNQDSAHDYMFALVENTTGTYVKCTYQQGIDYTGELVVGGVSQGMVLDGTGSHTVTVTMPEGSSTVDLKLNTSQYICPLSGSLNITAVRQA